MTTINDDLFAREVIHDPYSYFGRLREEDPVHWNEKHKLWIITSYAQPGLDHSAPGALLLRTPHAPAHLSAYRCIGPESLRGH